MAKQRKRAPKKDIPFEQEPWYLEYLHPLMANYLMHLQKAALFERQMHFMVVCYAPDSYTKVMQHVVEKSRSLATVLSGDLDHTAEREINAISAEIVEGIENGTHPLSIHYREKREE